MAEQTTQEVVIVADGFAGIAAAMQLA